MFGRAGVAAASMLVRVAAAALAASPLQKFLLSILYDFLGEFEQIVLLVLILREGATA